MEKYDYPPLTEYFFNAVKERNLESVKELFAKNPDFKINATDPDGNTLLHHALGVVDHNTYPLLQYLLSLGADPLAVNENFKNCIDLAKEMGPRGDIAISILSTYGIFREGTST